MIACLFEAENIRKRCVSMMNVLRRCLSSLLVVVVALLAVFQPITVSAWHMAPTSSVNMDLKLVGMMNVNIFGNTSAISNVSTATGGNVISGKTLYAKKFGGIWPHQVGDGPYNSSTIAAQFGTSAVTDCMTENENELAVYMLYDLGDPNSAEVQRNMELLHIDDINLYYQLVSENAALCIDAYAGGGQGHEAAITAYYRYSGDWRTAVQGVSSMTREQMLDLGIAAPNENRYFYETKESQKMLDGSDSIPGVNDPSVSQFIDTNESYSKPVWQDTNEDASWNIVNPVPTCNIYSRWYDDFSVESNYETCYEIREEKIKELYGEDYTVGQFNAVTGDPAVDNAVFAKNWEWASNPYYSAKSVKNGVVSYTTTNASKSHLGYGEYCPASTVSYHNFSIPENKATNATPSRFLTVMIRETGTICGLDGCGHWHTVAVSSASKSRAVQFVPKLQDDSVVIDYGLSVSGNLDANDWVWGTSEDASSIPNIESVLITAGAPDDDSGYTAGPVDGKYGTLELLGWSKQWGDGNCRVRYTPKIFVNAPDVFYYKVTPVDTLHYEPLVAKISVIPANIMYYEDSFSANDNNETTSFGKSLIYSGNWSYVDNNGNVTIGTAVNGEQSKVNSRYGFDVYYSDDLGFSDGSAHQGKLGDSLSFTFKGTGFDVIMRTDAMDGSVKYEVFKSTIAADGTSNNEQVQVTAPHLVSCRHNNDTTLYQLPVISMRYDDYAYYTVTLSGITSRNIFVDGIRVYNPLGKYGTDGADNQTIDYYYYEPEKDLTVIAVYDAIYDAAALDSDTIGFIGVTDNWNEPYHTEKDDEGAPADYSSLLTIGPNNEVYLAPGQAVSFEVTNTNIDDLIFGVEAKAVSGPTAMTVVAEGDNVSAVTHNINTNTAMYYFHSISEAQLGKDGIVRIENSGSDILSLTNLKYTSILTESGTFSYSFIDSDGIPVSNVEVTLIGTDGSVTAHGFSDENGDFLAKNLSLDTYYITFITPDDMSMLKPRKVTVDETCNGETEQFVLYEMNLNIGDAPDIFLTPTVEVSQTTVTFNDMATRSEAGSWQFTCTFDGINGGSGYINNNNFLKGTLTLTVNVDGSASYSFVGNGKTNGKNFSGHSGSISNIETRIRNGSIFDYNAILKAATGYSDNNFKFTDLTQIMPNGFEFTAQAFEEPDASTEGKVGNPATITVGQAPQYITTDTAKVQFYLSDEDGQPLAGVVVSSDSGITGTTDADGYAELSGVLFGERTFSFETPAGMRIDNVSDYFSPVHDQERYVLSAHSFDLHIGSYYGDSADPAVNVTTTTLTLANVRTMTEAGSYVIHYTFGGSASSSGYQDNNNYLNGDLTVTVNPDGTNSYVFTGSGKNRGNTLFNKGAIGTKSGTTASAVYSDGTININVITLMEEITGTSGNKLGLNNASLLIPEGTMVEITAYEEADAAGISGETAQLIIGAQSARLFAKAAHPYEYTVAVLPTHEHAGLMVGECPECESEVSIELPALSEDAYIVDEMDPTCTAPGAITCVSTDTEYGTLLFDYSVEAHGHNYVLTDEDVLVCAECGERFVAEDEEDHTEHVWDHGICTECGALENGIEDTALSFKSASLRLDEDININYTVEIPEGRENPRMIFRCGNNVVTVTDYTVVGGKLCFEYPGLTPQHMGDIVNATLVTEKDGELCYRALAGYSVRQYCVNMLTRYPDNEKLTALLSDLLAYGAAVQTYTGYQTDSLVTEGLELSPSVFPEDLSGYSISFSGEKAPEIDWKSASLLLSNNLAIRFTFCAESTEGLTVQTGINGRMQTFTAEDFKQVSGKENTYYVDFRGITAKEFADTVSASFFCNGTEIGRTVSYCVNAYICSVMNTDSNPSLSQLVRALYNYGKSAADY